MIVLRKNFSSNENSAANSLGIAGGVASLGTAGALLNQAYHKKAEKGVRKKIEDLSDESIVRRLKKSEKENLKRLIKNNKEAAVGVMDAEIAKGNEGWLSRLVGRGSRKVSKATGKLAETERAIVNTLKGHRENLINKGEAFHRKMAKGNVRNAIIGGSLAAGAGLGLGHYLKHKNQ